MQQKKRRKLKKKQKLIREAEEKAKDTNRRYIVAVTACPTGIAHTYMAEDAFKEKSEGNGC